MTMDSPVLKIDNISKAFGGLRIIQHVSFEVENGGRIALIGPNGAGKTTVFNLISGVYQVDEGSIIVGGENITGVPSRKRIGYGIARNFQNVRLMQHLTVLENLLLGQAYTSKGIVNLLKPFRLFSNHPWKQEALAELDRAGLADYAHATVQELPYGMRKRVDLVRATLARPKLLMLDEPAAGLNPAETDELLADLERLSTSGVSLLVVEHDMAFVREFCERTVVLNFGVKIAEGTMDEIEQDPQVREAYLGMPEGGQNAA